MTIISMITLFGGLALFIYGVDLMSSGMQQVAGKKLRSLLGAVVRHKSAGLLVGLILTFFLQSSSASTVMFVSFVQAGILAFRDTIALILGAMIGTTLTVQIIAFKVSDYALAAVAIGVAVQVFGKYERSKNWSNIILGIGLIFFGMAVMKSGIEPLKNSELFVKWLNTTIGNPWLSFAVATFFTAVVQASAATIALVISFAASGLLGSSSEQILAAALPFVMGANVGTTITALLASVRTGREAFRCAVTHTVMKLTGAVVCMFFVMPIANGTIWITSFFLSGEASSARIVANSHTFFNLINVIAFFPFSNWIAKFMIFVIPEKAERKVFTNLSISQDQSVDFNTEHNRLTDSLAAYSRMVGKLNLSVSKQYDSPDETQLEIIAARDETLDIGYREIRNHAMLLYQLPSMKKHSGDFIPIIRSSELLERLGDDFARSIVRSLKKIAREDICLSVESAAELQMVSKKIDVLLNSYAKALEKKDSKVIESLLENNRGIKSILRSMRKSHFLALANKVPAAVKSGSYYLDILSELESSTVKIKALLKVMREHFSEESIRS